MDFTLAPEHLALRRLIREFCDEELRPRAKQVDRESRQDPAVLRRMGEIGLFGVPFPQEYGGVGAGETGYCILMEELNRACPSTATIVGAHIGIAAMSLYLDGSSELKQKYLPDLCSGRKIASF
ncbi:MAG: acyl-CoA dehydrogenase family protein, partial [Anaerolineales bacterium]